LDPRVLESEETGEEVRQGRLADARDVLDQEVTAGEETRQGKSQLSVLPEDDRARGPEDLLAEAGPRAGRAPREPRDHGPIPLEARAVFWVKLRGFIDLGVLA
jgi:hypothetical protein